MRTRNSRVNFKAYRNGELISHTWTSSSITYTAEIETCKTLIKKGHYDRVEVIFEDPQSKIEILPKKSVNNEIRS